MTRICSIGCLILGMLFVCIPVSGSELPNVSVVGEVRDLVTPDQMSWQVMVRNEGSQVKTVAKVHSELTKKTVRYLLQSGIKEKEIQTSRMQLSENWVYKKGSRIKQGYFASTMIAFKSSELKRYETLWIGLSEIESLSIKGVGYGLADQGSNLDRLRNRALADARRKARSMASALDAEIGEPLMIEELSPMVSGAGHQRVSAKSEMMLQVTSGDSMSMPGLIPIYLSVRVKFRLISFNTP